MNRMLKDSALLITLTAMTVMGVARLATADPPAASAASAGTNTTAATTATTATAAIDQKAPDFSLTGIDGKTYRLADFKGKYVVLEWNNWVCPFVKKHYGSGNMQALQKKYTGEDVVWLTICSSAPGKQGYYEPAELKKIAKEQKVASSAYLRDTDGTVGRAYGARTTPTMFVINPDGNLIYAGAIDDRPSTNPNDIKGASNYVASCLDASFAGKPVTTRTTVSYGCGVKYAD